MSDLHKQLERWSRAEPERCQREKLDGLYRIRVSDKAFQYVEAIHPTDEMLMIVQAAVQAAMVARGWAYSVDWLDFGEGGKGTRSRIYIRGSRLADVKIDGIYSPALALLTCYCDSLEAMR